MTTLARVSFPRSSSPLHWAPLRYAAARVLRRNVDIRAQAVELHEWSPTVECLAPKALFDPADLSRVRAVQADTSWPAEKRRILGGPITHAATSLYRLRHALLSGSHVYAGEGRLEIAPRGSASLRPRRPAASVQEGMLVSSLFASKYFGHWFTDQLTAELLASERGLAAYASARQTAYTHEQPLRSASGLRVEKSEELFFENLWMAVDYGQNASKRARYEQLRARLRRGANPVRSRGVFILRGQHGARRPLRNEAELCDRLVREGFLVIDPEGEDFCALRDVLHDAPIVVGVEGSALIHGVMTMPSEGSLLVIQPPQRFNNVLKDYTDCLGQRYAFTVADGTDDAGFFLPPERLLRFIERLERH